MRPYRTCGLSGGFCFFVNFPKFVKLRFIPLRTSPKKSKKRQAITRFSKTVIPLRTSPKKSKKRQAKTLLLQIRCTPIALPAPRPEPLIFRVPPLCLIFDQKPIIPLRTSLKKSKKRQAKTSLLKIRCTPIALAALAALAAYFLYFFQLGVFFQKYGRSDPLAQNRWKSLYCRSKSMEIDKKRCTVVFSVQKSMKIVVLSFKINGIRCILYQKRSFRCGGPQKSRKNVKRKHNFCKFGAPLSHLRPLCRIFWFNCSCYLLVLATSCYHLFLYVIIFVTS